MLVVTTTMGMLHRVHGNTTHLASKTSVTKLQNNHTEFRIREGKTT